MAMGNAHRPSINQMYDWVKLIRRKADAGDHLDAAKLPLVVNRRVNLMVISILLHRTRSSRDP